jgi:hypothetical protein
MLVVEHRSGLAEAVEVHNPRHRAILEHGVSGGAWAASNWFQQLLQDVFGQTTAINLLTHTANCALYNNTTTPDRTVSAANSAYNAGQWVVANEVSQSGQWAAGGVAIPSFVESLPSAGTWKIAGSNPASGSAATLANVYGCLVYDATIATPVAKQGLCFNYFGGVQSVTGGTFTVVWNASGIATITV